MNECASFLPRGGGSLQSRRLAMSCLVPAIAAVLLVSLLGAGAAFAEQEAPYLDIRKVAAATEGRAGYTELYAAHSITTVQINSKHYALVASLADSGVQIIDITDPSSPSAVAAVTEGRAGYTELHGAASITTAQIGARHYALVAAWGDDGVQIIDITDPSSPSAVAAATDDTAGYTELDGAASVTTAQINSKHYALVASANDDGVQIINITNPSSPSPVASITDGATYPTLGGAHSITTAQINSKHYALVAASDDNGVQIINITNPSSPSPVASITDGATYPTLGGAHSITTAQINSKHYALVAASDDNGIQIIDITDPSSPSPVANITDGAAYTELNGAASITTTQIGARHYALVAAWGDDGVQIIDITDPSSPSAVAAATDDTAGYTELDGAASITTAQINSKHYALVAAFDDSGVQIISIAQSTQQQQQTLETETEEQAPDAEEIWSAILFPYGARDSSRGCWGDNDVSGCHVNLRPHTFAYGGETYEVYLAVLTDKGFLTVRLNNTIQEAQDATLVINGTSFDFDASITKFPKWHYRLDWSEANSVTMSLRINQDQYTPEPTTSTVPVITLAGASQMTIPVNTAYTEPGYTATDPEDGDLTGSVTITGTVDATQVGTYTIYYDVTDGSGNAAVQQVRTVRVVDMVAPVITLTGASSINVQVGSTYSEPGYTATDDYDGDLTGSVSVTGTVDTTRIGTYYLYYDVADGSGNAAVQQVRTVRVLAIPEPPHQEGAPTVASPLADVSLEGPEALEISLSGVFHDAGSLTIRAISSNHAVASMWVSADYSTLTVVGISTGTATITVTAEDTDGNRVSDAFEVTVSPTSAEQP